MHTIGTAAVIIHDQQVLLIRRNDLPVWAVPGGGLDPHETIDACCVREVKEETGLVRRRDYPVWNLPGGKDSAANHTDVVFRVQDTPSGLRLQGYK